MNKKGIIATVLVAVVAVGAVLAFVLTGDMRAYSAAERLYDEASYAEAAEQFDALGDYSDAGDRATQCRYQIATELYEAGDYAEAAEQFADLGDYDDAGEMYARSQYALATEWMEGENYARAEEIFLLIPDYGDSAEKLEELAYLQSTDGQFMAALALGLQNRWDVAAEGDSLYTDTEIVANLRDCIQAELDAISDFGGMRFADGQLGQMCLDYLELLNESMGALDYYVMDYSTYSDIWETVYAKRTVMIRDFYQDYDLPVEESYLETLDSLLSNAVAADQMLTFQQELESILENAELVLEETSYGWSTYIITLENTTSQTLEYFQMTLTLQDGDGIILDTTYSNSIENFAPGQKARFEFHTDKAFESYVLSANYW